MNQTKIPRSDTIFLEALERNEGPERAAFLDKACGDDPELRRALDNMLKDDSAADAFFESATTLIPPGGAVTIAGASDFVYGEKPGTMIGHYQLVQIVGEGGFGSVWQAHQEEPVHRMVALKIIKPGMDTREVLARFEQERQALAMMDHPGIARVFDAGATGAGRPYFVMELITGESLTKYCDLRLLDMPARLRLMAEVCTAVQHAHQKGIIHRDLKPSNVLVTELDGQPVAKVIDFGIAKAITPHGEEHNSPTRTGQFIGTPAYMSPEQASFEGGDIDTRSDIYSLGVMLYQLLTGTTPFESKTSRGADLDEIRRMIREDDPPPPSTAVGRLQADVLTSVLKTRKTALRELSRLLRRDLDWIVMKALEKDRNRRYESASAFAADLRRYLAGEPVVARPPTLSYRAGKFIRRRKGPVISAAALLLALVGGLGASTTLFIREKAALRRESAERAKVQVESASHAQTAKFLSDMLAGVSPEIARGKDTSLLKEILGKAAGRLGSALKNQPGVQASLHNTIGSTYFSMGEFARAKAHFEAGLPLAKAVLGEKDRLTLRLRGNLANILHTARLYPEAEAENRAILAIREREFPPDDIETLATMDNLANEIAKQGRFPEASEIYRGVLPLQQQALGASHADTLRTRMALANIMGRLSQDSPGKLAAVEKDYQEIVALMEQSPTLGPKDPLTLEARYGLADVLYFGKHYKEAEEEHHQVYLLRDEVLKPTHKKTFQSRAGAARAMAGRGDLKTAIARFEAILADQQATPQRDEGDYRSNQQALAALKQALHSETN